MACGSETAIKLLPWSSETKFILKARFWKHKFLLPNENERKMNFRTVYGKLFFFLTALAEPSLLYFDSVRYRKK